MGKTNFNELREHLESTPQGRQELERARGEVAQALRLADLRRAQSWAQETLAEALDTQPVRGVANRAPDRPLRVDAASVRRGARRPPGVACRVR